MASDIEPNEKVSNYWGDERATVRSHNWLEHPVAREWINKRVSGDVSIGVAEHWRRRFIPKPVPLALSTGCGFGGFERMALSMGLAERFEACDVSKSAIEQARTYAKDAGLADRVTYQVIDLDRSTLPEGRYDAIFGISSVHHVGNLEDFFESCRAALKPGGLLFMDEYVGPSRFQSSPATVKLINDVIGILPPHYRRNVFNGGLPSQGYANPPISWFEENDPSEAIRSEEILPILERAFDIVEIRSYGGALLHMLLSGTAGNFDPTVDADVAMLRCLALMEEALEDAGALRPDFAAIVARPKSRDTATPAQKVAAPSEGNGRPKWVGKISDFIRQLSMRP
jgi:2-polyprenyl-3-methyl-5-hydroxy-6-metoxy-1,4-benzoquinol methylase